MYRELGRYSFVLLTGKLLNKCATKLDKCKSFSLGECASLLHPDHAWGSRRGSSQSEQLEAEVYQLGKDFSRSLPGSRRSSFQSAQEQQAAEQVFEKTVQKTLD